MSIFDDHYANNAGADHLADIFGTEKDKVNCPFYWKIGACRHGEKCSRNHNKPALSQTLLIPHMYPNPLSAPILDTQGHPLEYDKEFLQENFDEFYEDVFDECSKFGRIEELNVCENVAEHMLGNVYVKYSRESEAQKALDGLKNRYYAGRVMAPEFSPVTDFKEARCKLYEQTVCERGGSCNFMHLKKVSDDLGYDLFGDRFRHIKYGYGSGKGGDRSSGGGSYHHHHRDERDRPSSYHHGGSSRDYHRSSRSSRDYYYDRDERRSSRSDRDYRGSSGSGRSSHGSSRSSYDRDRGDYKQGRKYENSGTASTTRRSRTPPSSYEWADTSNAGQKRKRNVDSPATDAFVSLSLDTNSNNDGGTSKKMRHQEHQE